jgi:hypothetical protein
VTATNNRSPRDIYLYLVRLVMLTTGVFAAANLVRSAADIIYPQQDRVDVSSLMAAQDLPSTDPATVQAVEAYRYDSASRSAILNLVMYGTLMLLASAVYYIYWLKTGPDT